MMDHTPTDRGDTMPVHNPPVVAATVTLLFADQSMRTIDIHEGAAIGVNLSQDTNHDEDAVARGGYRPAIISDRLRMELRASATQGGGEFVTITQTGPGESTTSTPNPFADRLAQHVADAIPVELTATPHVGAGEARRLKIAQTILPVVLAAVCAAEGHRRHEITTFAKPHREFLCGRCAHRWTEPHPGGTP